MLYLLRRAVRVLAVRLQSILAPAEDPRRTFATAYRRQQEVCELVRRALAELATSQERLRTKIEVAQEQVPQFEQQARQALSTGREDLARLALRQRQAVLREIRLLEQQAGEIQHQEQRLALYEQRLATQIAAFVLRLQGIAARYSAAEAQVRLHEMLHGAGQELAELGLVLEQAEHTTEHIQAHAAALDRLAELGILQDGGLLYDDALDRRITQLVEDQGIADQIAALKREVHATGAGAMADGS